MATSPVFKMNHAAEERSISACKCQAGTSKHKTKRLRSRKERSQTRGRKDCCQLKMGRCHLDGGLDVRHLHGCCRHGRRRDGASPPPPPLCEALAPTQEASVITEARLIGHRGLFNREVKSIDIERLLFGKKEATVKETSSHVMSDASGPDEEVQATRAQESQASDKTPSQREQEQPSSACSADAPLAKTRKPDPRQRPPPSADRAKKPPEQERAPTPILRRPVAAETGVKAHAQSQGATRESVAAVSRRLREALRFPSAKKRDLVAESREVLLRALREAHGQRLQENLLHMRSGGRPRPHQRREVHHRKARDRRLTPDAFPSPFQAHSSDAFFFGSEDSLVLGNARKGTKQVSWGLGGSPLQHVSQLGAWLTSPKDSSAGFLEDIIRPRILPEFSMDFGPSSSSSAAVHGLFDLPDSWSAEPPAYDFGKATIASDPFEDLFAQGRWSPSQARSTRHGPSRELSGRYSQEDFPLQRDALFESQQYSFAPTFSSHPLTSLRDHPYSLESTPSLFASLSSPKHWSFHPRKLY
ncbi:uncharacterized protein LOC127600515 [Hippocampus zosterae]|uniref:uncharacterized protein LOC127600515 n=1 Tax=Hippocampus zosterae TaxID=109293 RepID=UPI00223D1C84|nr:uncharacterized protein LOC127600515 [Hippocampus zosterae]XP_051921112.1 uncharacterized protein LOC127600515 [Hippocampus zosterae]